MPKRTAQTHRSPSGARLLPTNLPRLFSFEAVPEGFDARRASIRTLLRHGIPPRPQGKGAERAARTWDEMMSRKFRHIHPHFEVTATARTPPSARRDLKKRPSSGEGGGSANADLRTDTWSGGIAFPNGAAKMTTVYGNWVVPTVRRPSGASDSDSPWASSTWVGMDGWISKDVLQAGTVQRVDATADGDIASYYAWYEWYPNLEVRITNFAVQPGDAMFVYVRFEGPDANQVIYGSAWLVNLTANTETSIYFYEPGATAKFTTGYAGDSAECIMERQDKRQPNGTDVPGSFPHYGEVAFTNFGACADDQSFYTAANCQTIIMKSSMPSPSDGSHSNDIVCRPDA